MGVEDGRYKKVHLCFADSFLKTKSESLIASMEEMQRTYTMIAYLT